MNENITFYVSDYAKAVNWYVNHLGVMPVYIDSTWAVFAKNGVKLSVINHELVTLCEEERKMSAAFSPAYAGGGTVYLTPEEAAQEGEQSRRFEVTLH